MKWIVLSVVACLQLGLTAAQSPINPPVTAICGLDGYTLQPLHKNANGWHFQVPSTEHCIVPEGASESDVKGCVIYFSVCQSLPYPFNGSSIGQEVTYQNSSTVNFDMGKYNTAMKFEPSATDELEGFIGAYVGEDLVSTRCNGSLSTIFTYKCDSDAQWSSQHGDVSGYLLTVELVIPDNCLYLISMRYDGACYEPPTLSPSLCQLDGYDIFFIANVSIWLIQADPSTCAGVDATTCTMMLSFCHPVNPGNGDSCTGSSICQISEVGNNDQVEYSMGQFENSTRFVENDDDVDGGFHIQVSNGSNVTKNNEVCQLKTRVVLVCNGTAMWNNETTNITEHAKIAYDAQNGQCEYTLVIQYSGACLTVPPIVDRPRHSIVGWIFIGIFLFAVLCYLLVGASFQYFVRRERGVKILPNYDFWKAFTIYTLEGCKFTLDAITCFKFEGRMPTRTVDYDKI